MANNQSIKERLLLFIDSVGLGKSQFENACGLSHGWINGIKVNVSPDKLEKITLQFPDLNAAWLLTGEGSMLKTRLYESDEQEKVLTSEWYRGLLNEYNNVKEENEQLKEENEALNHVDKTTAITDVYIKKDWSVIDRANRKVLDFVDIKMTGG